MRLWRYFTNLLRSVFAVGILAGAILFIVVYPFTDAVPDELAGATVLVATVAIVIAVLRKIRLVLWMAVTFTSYAIGLIYATELLLTPEVDGGYRAAVMTITVFVLHGFAAGAFVELVTALHRVTERALDAFKEKMRLKLEEE